MLGGGRLRTCGGKTFLGSGTQATAAVQLRLKFRCGLQLINISRIAALYYKCMECLTWALTSTYCIGVIGIMKGKPFAPAQRMKKILT